MMFTSYEGKNCSYQDFLDKRVAANKEATEPRLPLS